jgi:hypothetical protein
VLQLARFNARIDADFSRTNLPDTGVPAPVGRAGFVPLYLWLIGANDHSTAQLVLPGPCSSPC